MFNHRNMKKYIISLFSLLLPLAMICQNIFTNPTDIVFHPGSNSVFIASLHGYIVRIDKNNNQEMFVTGLSNCYGLLINADTLIVACGSSVKMIDVYSATIIKSLNVPGAKSFCTDGTGTYFCSDFELNMVISCNLAAQQWDTLASEGLNQPFGLEYDHASERIIVCCGDNNELKSVDPVSGEVGLITETGLGSIDAICAGPNGRFYVTSWLEKAVFQYDSNFLTGPELLSSGHNGPSGLFYLESTAKLGITCFNSSTYDLITLGGNVIQIPEDFPSIQLGIDNALHGDTILVGPGTYYENISFEGKNIVVASHFVYNNDVGLIGATIIDGSQPSDADSASCVRFMNGEDSTAVLQGFTLTGGTGSLWVDPAFPTLTWRSGGGIMIFQSSPSVRNNLIKLNEVTDMTGVDGAQGGGMTCFGGNPRVYNNVIIQNQALYGAGIVVDYSGAMIRNNLICSNSGGETYGGGGIWVLGNGTSPIIIENNTIAENVVTGSGIYGGKGGGMFIWMGSVTAMNNIIWGNTQSQGGQIALIGGGTAEITYSNIEGSFAGEGNIDEDPLFIGMQYYLAANSPCIDAGNPQPIYNDPEDPANSGYALWPSRGNLRNDMGAFGGPDSEMLADITTGIPAKHFIEPRFWPFYISPNPFGKEILISMPDIYPPARITVTGLLGETIDIIDLQAIPIKYTYNTYKLPPGIYVFTLETNNNRYSRKAIKVK